MAKWIAEAEQESDDDEEKEDVTDDRQRAKMVWKWKPTTLLLFGGEKPLRSRLPPEEVDAESRLMEALAELEEDERVDGGEIEIPSDEDGPPTRYLEIEYNIEFLLNYALRVPLILTLNLN